MSKMALQPHAEMCDKLEALVEPLITPPYRHPTQRKLLELLPRGVFKTTVGSVGLPIYCIDHNPNIRIALYTHTLDYSMEILSEIKERAQTEAFIAEHGDWRKDEANDLEASAWRANAITVAKRTEPYKEPTIVCAGVDKSKVGGHYDLIIADDLADGKNTQTEKGRAKTLRVLKGFVPILNPGGAQLVIGTRWHLQDCYDTIIRNDIAHEKKGEPVEYEKLIRQIWLPDGRPYFPTEFPPKVIESLRQSLTDQEFSIWYLNEAIEAGMRVFPRSLMRFFDGQFYIDDKAQPIAQVTPV